MENKVEYLVTRVTYAHKMCSYCGGTGKVEGKFRVEKCPYCKNGVATIEHQASVSLMDALKELGLIKKQSENEKTTTTKTTTSGSDK
jgi:tRNA(Ile2) C34 agmatinyltransferase TiaS